jgi:hypothetical protein
MARNPNTPAGLKLLSLTLIGLLMAGQTTATERHISFVACPLIRDIELPCWLAEYEGELYFLGMQGDSASSFYSPQLKHQALIEARVGTGPRICGGIPLEKVHVSVMQEIDLSCDTILPGEGHQPPPYERGPGPALRPHSRPPAPDPAPPFEDREFVLELQFDTEFLARRNSRQIEDVVRLVELSRPAAVRIQATRGSSRLSNGQVIVEAKDIARRRAEHVRRILVDLGVAESLIDTQWSETALPGNGIDDHTRRKITVTVQIHESDRRVR